MISYEHLARPTAEQCANIAHIEALCFPHPWSATHFHSTLHQSHARCSLVHSDGNLIGYCLTLSLNDTNVEILKIAIALVGRRQGCGATLLSQHLAHHHQSDALKVFLEVRASNSGARRFYEQLGFTELSRRVDYYTQPAEDAIVLSAHWQHTDQQ